MGNNSNNNCDSDFTMPFGKYTGIKLEEIPLKYLDWLIGQDWLKDPVKMCVEEYMSNDTVQRELDSELDYDLVEDNDDWGDRD